MSDPFVPPGGPLPSADGARPTPQVPPVGSGARVPQAPTPGAYRVPVGGYHAPVGGYAVPAPVRPSRRTGALALASAIVATLVTRLSKRLTGAALDRLNHWTGVGIIGFGLAVLANVALRFA